MRIVSPVVALVALAVPAVAIARPVVAYGDSYYQPDPEPRVDPDPDHHLQPEAAVGFLVGSYGIGPIRGVAYGLQLAAGARFNRLLVQAEYDFLSVGESATEDDPVRGLVHRIGGNLRYSFAVLAKNRFPLRGDFWLEVGAGRQFLRWYDGGKLARNDVSIGLGGQLSVRWGDTRRKKVGLFYSLKMIGSRRADDKMLPPSCAGPCDEPTGPIPYDLGVFFNFAVVFGR